MIFKALHVTGLVLVFVLMSAAGVWGALAMYYLGPQTEILRYGLMVLFTLFTLGIVAAFASRWRRWSALGLYMLTITLLIGCFFTIEPSNDRDWQTDVAVLPYAEVEGDLVTFHNIRNFDYRSETDYTPAYYDKSFELSKLERVDIVAVYWMGPAIAHVFLSFAFSGGEHLAASIETRKEKNEEYSTIKGFFRQYELYYVVADERDVMRLRTNYRFDPPEDVYVYPLKGTLGNARQLFLEYVKKINSLNEQPEFYNSLTTNCTTNIWLNSLVNPDHLPFDWKIIASGYLPEYLYDKGRLNSQGLSYPDLRKQVHVNARAQAADNAADFSERIRKVP